MPGILARSNRHLYLANFFTAELLVDSFEIFAKRIFGKQKLQMYQFEVPYRRSGFSRDVFEFAAKAAPTATP